MAKRFSNDWLPHTLWLKYIVAKALVAGRQTARGQGRRESGQGRGQRDARAEPRQRADSGLPCVGVGIGGAGDGSGGGGSHDDGHARGEVSELEVNSEGA